MIRVCQFFLMSSLNGFLFSLLNPYEMGSSFIGIIKASNLIMLFVSVFYLLFQTMRIPKKYIGLYKLTGVENGFGKLILTPLIIGIDLFILSCAYFVDIDFLVAFVLVSVLLLPLLLVSVVVCFVAYDSERLYLNYYNTEKIIEKEELLSFKRKFMRWYKLEYKEGDLTKKQRIYVSNRGNLPYSFRESLDVQEFRNLWNLNS